MKAALLKAGALLCVLSPFVSGAQTVSYLRNNSFTNWESPQVHPLDLTPDGTRLLAVNTANNTLEIYNTASSNQAPSFVRSVPVGLDPVTVRARTNTEAWVVNVISDSVSVVDLQNGIVTATLQADDEPADVIFAGASQGSAFVSCAQAKTLMVFNALAPTGSAPQRIPINGEQPRALATSANGRFVYLAIFESGNTTTIVPGGVNNGYEHSVVDDTSGPYGGVNAPPNNGANFNPALNPANPPPIPVSLIVRKSVNGTLAQWLDDNGKDWSAFITGAKARTGTPGDRVAGWDMPDRDVAVIDTSNGNALTYQAGLMNMVMSIGVNPSTGTVTVVGTDATNQIRYEPVLQSTFVHVEGATFTPGGANTIFDLNPQINYQVKSVPMAQRLLSIGDPRGIVWNAAGTTSYITGMGSNNVILTSNTGARQGLINVGQGPTGIVLNEVNGRAFVLNRFDATISTISLGSQSQAFVTPLQYDPTPAAIKAGRPLLYNTHLNSGLGQVSCGSCHVDGRTDRLAWDLGNPAGSVVTNAQGISFHPMKGPLLTMTLVDMIQAPFLHWRGDRQLDDFEGAFQTLQGGDTPATNAEMATMQAFMATITLPPNPYRNLDNSYSTSVNMPGPNNTVYINGNAVLGAQEFEGNCRSCHVGETNRGANFVTGNTEFGVGARNPPNWKNFYKRTGLWFGTANASNVGFGTQQDGTFDSSQNQSRDANMYAFMMSMNGGYPYEPAGLNATNWSNNTHAAVGKQVTLSPSNPTDSTGLLAQLETLAGQGAIGLVAKGAVLGSPVRGWFYLGNNLWQSDHLAEVDATSTLNNNITNGAALTFTAVPTESAVRIGVDMDGDGILDSDDPNPAIPNANPADLALGGTATGPNGYSSPSVVIDGSTMGYFDQGSVFAAGDGTGVNSWWQVDLGTSAQISLVQLFNRWDCCGSRMTNVSVFVSQTPFTSTALAATVSQPGVQQYFISGAMGLVGQIPMSTQGRYVRVELNDTTNAVQLAEVRVMGYAIGSFTNPGTQTTATGVAVNLPLTFTNTSGNTYTFSATNLPPGLSINSSTGAISGTPVVTATASYGVTVTAAGPGNPSTSFTWNVTGPAASFKLAASQPALTVASSQVGNVTVTVVPAGGFSGSVAFSASGAPSGVSTTFTPTSSTTGTNLALAVTNAAAGTYPIVVTGTSGSLTASTTVSLTTLQSQTIAFAAIPTQLVNTQLALKATASSGLAVAYTSTTASVCTVSGSTATLLAAGTCSITASQAGNSTYTSAASVSQSFTVSATQTAVAASLASSFNIYGIENNGTAPTNGGLDTATYAYSENLLGTSLTAIGVPFSLGSPGVADAVSNATISLPAGNFSAVDFLATAVFGNQASQNFLLTYTDGTTSTFTQSISDWGSPQSYSGETTALNMAYRVTPSGTTQNAAWYLYAYSAPITSGKTVKSITLPASRNVVVLAVTLVPATAASVTPSFTLASSPASVSVAAGASSAGSVVVTPAGGFSGAVSFAVTGLPNGVTATFGTASGNTYPVTLAASTGTVAGTYPLTITGASGTLKASTSLSLTVSAGTAIPAQPALNTTICQATQNGGGSFCSDQLPSATAVNGLNTLPSWTNLQKTLTSITVADNQVWGLDSTGTLWFLPNFKVSVTNWIQVATGISQISAGHNLLCQLNTNTHVLCSVAPNPSVATPTWFDAGATNYKQIAVSAGNQIWAVDANSNLIQIPDYTNLASTAIEVAYGYQQVAVDGKGLLCGSAVDSNVYCNNWPVPPAAASGGYHSLSGWVKVGILLQHIALADGAVYGTDSSGNVNLLPDYTNSATWQKIYAGGVGDVMAAASAPSAFTPSAFSSGDVAVMFFMGQSNSSGINTLPAQFIAPTSPNVHGVTNAGWNFLTGNVNGTTPFTSAISTISSVGWSNWSVAANGAADMNLGFNSGAAGNAANFAAFQWQGMINAGAKLPDLYIIHIAWPSEGVDAADATTATASWLVHGENLWTPLLTNTSQPSYALAPFARRILYDALNNLLTAGKTPRIMGLQWNQWEAEAEAANTKAIPDAPTNYANLFNGFDTAIGSHFPVQIIKPLSTNYGAATGQMQTVFANLASADPVDYSVLDVSQAETSIFSGGVLGGGDGSVHYNLDTHRWFAREAIGACLTSGNCGPRLSALPSTPTN